MNTRANCIYFPQAHICIQQLYCLLICLFIHNTTKRRESVDRLRVLCTHAKAHKYRISPMQNSTGKETKFKLKMQINTHRMLEKYVWQNCRTIHGADRPSTNTAEPKERKKDVASRLTQNVGQKSTSLRCMSCGQGGARCSPVSAARVRSSRLVLPRPCSVHRWYSPSVRSPCRPRAVHTLHWYVNV